MGNGTTYNFLVICFYFPVIFTFAPAGIGCLCCAIAVFQSSSVISTFAIPVSGAFLLQCNYNSLPLQASFQSLLRFSVLLSLLCKMCPSQLSGSSILFPMFITSVLNYIDYSTNVVAGEYFRPPLLGCGLFIFLH